MGAPERRPLRSSRNQIEGVLSRIFIHSHCKVQSHNPKGGCACREKKESLISITRIVQGLNLFTYLTKLDYRKWE